MTKGYLLGDIFPGEIVSGDIWSGWVYRYQDLENSCDKRSSTKKYSNIILIFMRTYPTNCRMRLVTVRGDPLYTRGWCYVIFSLFSRWRRQLCYHHTLKKYVHMHGNKSCLVSEMKKRLRKKNYNHPTPTPVYQMVRPCYSSS